MSGALDRSRSSLRRLIAPGIATAVVVAILIALGVWQLERLAWKRGLLAQIDQAESAPAVTLTDDPPPFSKVSVTGTYRHPVALYGSEVRDTPQGSRIGAYLLEPLVRPGARPVIVNRGWVPTDTDQAAFVDPLPVARIEGYVRAPDPPGAFTPANDPTTHRFFNLDPAAIGASLGVTDAEPFTVIELRAVPLGTYPAPASDLPRPPNDHLSYAITWFSLAIVALATFVIHSRKALRT